ncbi:FAD/FMN-containing dehydrogenase [Amycolatopsis xylanica]|uniref:FAD/FMN-containing dehydrogenase n=1 Tax=Amycolatopsis xylanica TaxID=589385 RepID=A0A1H2UCG9_9PSEU|nr:FAD-binding oxidoreductase [Amycolatopsis xylanica]SDW53598.1 FAD/FMN-containing dehydrogenase [Amycolatopsis xylanica]
MTSLAAQPLSTLRATLTGAVFTAGDPSYDTARGVWNGQIDRMPAVIARCATPSDVVAALEFARGNHLDIAVRGGGHNFGGAAVLDDGLVVDTSGLRKITVDPAARTARCGGGVTWAELDAATQAHGLAVPGGTISHTGVGGLTLGGGFGWLTALHGLSCDNLRSAELVTADGRVLRTSAGEHPDLYWALRGGGGNFGVVTEFEFQLHEVGPLVQLGLFFWALDDGAEALRLSREIIDELPAGMSALVAALNAPPAPFVPTEHHFRPGYALILVGFADADDHAAAAAAVRDGLAPLFELVTPIPYTELQKMLDESAPWGTLAYEKAVYVDGFSDEVIDVITEFVPQKTSPMSLMPIFPLTGAFTEVDADATAFGGPRRPTLAMNIGALAMDMATLETDRAWVRRFWERLVPHAANSGGYVNFMAEYEQDRVRTAYGKAKYDRLAAIKAIYDPDNVFHHNANIRPAQD